LHNSCNLLMKGGISAGITLLRAKCRSYAQAVGTGDGRHGRWAAGAQAAVTDPTCEYAILKHV
jgi:hypothetical protein